jgi:Zn-dependent M16 (insulinase) family peptidase
MEERLEHEASECSRDLIQPLLNFQTFVPEQFRKEFYEMIETQLQSSFFTGISKSRSIVRDRQEEIKDTAAEAAKWM